jgi:beta-lactamase superfamily II metal-dependent hydrolase
MNQYWTAPLLLGGLLLASAGASGQASATLDFSTIDVEGGKAVLVVSPSRQSMLIDVGWPKSAAREASTDAIVNGVKQAGLSEIDYLVLSHFDVDHMGDVPALAARIPIRHIIDHGDIRFPQPTAGAAPPTAAIERFNAYAALRKTLDHRVVAPGDAIPLKGVGVEVLTSAGAHLSKPARSAKGAGAANPLCATYPQQPIIERDVEDNQSIGLLFSFGNFRMLDLADLEGHSSHELVCPLNLVGQVDVYHVNVHGQFKGMAAELAGAVKPAVAIMGNGPRKGADPETWPVLRAVPGLQDIWQIHYAEHGSPETNPLAAFIANLQGPADDHQMIKVSVSPDGSYSMTNTRNGFSKTYRSR